MTLPTLQIDQRTIGPTHPPFVIAEIGVNHDGSLDKALQLVNTAAACGADAVKLQIFRAQALLHPTAAFAQYQKDNTTAESPFEFLKQYELSHADIRRVVRRIRDRKMIPLATPFSPADVDIIDSLRLPAIKIASPDLVNRPLLEQAAKLDKPLLISTGAATMDEVQTTVQWLREWDTPFALLHCISAYPVKNDSANLAWIDELAYRFDCPVGYSDHTTSHLAGALATAAGACVIEKHLTYDRTAKGPDHAASADPRVPSILNDWLHLVSAAVWLGGAAALVLLWWPVVRFTRAPVRAAIAREVVAPFGRVAAGAFALVVATGLVSLVTQLGRIAALWETAYGRVLSVKIVVVAAIAYVGVRRRPRGGGSVGSPVREPTS